MYTIYVIVQKDVDRFDLYQQFSHYNPFTDIGWQIQDRKENAIGLYLRSHTIKLILKDCVCVQEAIIFSPVDEEYILTSYQLFIKSDLYVYFSISYDPNEIVLVG